MKVLKIHRDNDYCVELKEYSSLTSTKSYVVECFSFRSNLVFFRREYKSLNSARRSYNSWHVKLFEV